MDIKGQKKCVGENPADIKGSGPRLMFSVIESRFREEHSQKEKNNVIKGGNFFDCSAAGGFPQPGDKAIHSADSMNPR